MKRQFRKFPSNYVRASKGKTYSEYPDVIYYPLTVGSGRSYKYVPKCLHEANPDHYNMEGMYYRVIEICDGSTPFRPVTQADINEDIAEIDVYPDGFVGYKGNGKPWLYRLNPLGRLVDNVII